MKKSSIEKAIEQLEAKKMVLDAAIAELRATMTQSQKRPRKTITGLCGPMPEPAAIKPVTVAERA